MADTVAFVLEAMVPELEDFHVRGLFTRTEIQRIVAQRTAHEYAMKRRAPDKTDFLRAIEYEEQVESLRRHRKKLQNAVLAEEEAAVAQHQAGGQQGSKQSRGPQQQRRSQSGAGDHSIVRRIHFLYTRALRKFRGDLRLWARLFSFCRAHGGGRALSRSLASALALHPTQPGLWAYAASWELRGRRDLHAARTLMQRGLRSCTESSDLWVDYFSLELHAANLLRQRASVLGLPVRDEDEDEEGAEEGAADGITLQDGDDAPGEDAAAATATAAAQERARLRRGRAALMRGAVAVTVFNAACDARPLDVALRLRCLSAARAAGEWTARHVVSHILRRLGDGQWATHPDAVRARADAADDYTSGVAVFEAALAAAPSAGVFSVYADWVERRMSGATDGGAPASGDVAAALEALARRALRDRVAGDTLLLSAARSLSAAGRDAAAMQLVQDGVQQLKHSVPLWTALLRATAARGSDTAALTKACVMALQAVPSTEAEHLWTEALSLCAAVGADVAPLHSCLAAHHARGVGQHCGASTGAALRVSAMSHGGVTAARALWDQLVQMPGVAPRAFVTALRLEAAALRSSAGGDDLMYRLTRAMGESAIAAHGSHSEDVWRAYLALEMDAPNTGTPSRAERVATMLRRANRQLGQPLADVVIC